VVVVVTGTVVVVVGAAVEPVDPAGVGVVVVTGTVVVVVGCVVVWSLVILER
jgi:hypothetical protein